MKKLISMSAILIITTAALVGCGSNTKKDNIIEPVDVCPNLPGIQTNPADCPTPLPVIVTLTATPTDSKRGDTSFFNEVNRTFAMGAQNASSFGITGEAGNSVSVPTVTAPTRIDWWAKNSAGTTINGSKTFPLYTENKTNLVGNVAGVKWHPDFSRKTIVSDTLVNPAPSATWEITVISTLDRRFYTDGSGSTYGGPVSPGSFVYTLLEGDNWINFQQVNQKIFQVTDLILVLRHWQKDPFSTTWYCHESHYSRS
ncbi:MAG: hypothetical protein AAB477_01685 [Patescibacteria group bacterium]|mgnify:CR=1 FL=1